MNRRELMAAMSIFPFVGKQKVRLDRIKMMSFTIDGQAMYLSKIETSDTYFDPKAIKHIVKTYDEVVLEDGNKNVLKVNKLNKGFVLLKLDLIK